MRLLVLGGSWFVGRAVVEQALLRGHAVTTFNRGRTPIATDHGVHQLHGDWERDDDVAQLAESGPWDSVIDVAGVIPRLVGRCARALEPVVDRYLFMSTISAYADWPYREVDEDSPTWDASPDHDPGTRVWDPDAYGPLKVGSELAAQEAFGAGRLTILRPHVVLGPAEYVGRLPWWLTRIARGGETLVPGPNRTIQPIDVRDLAAFAVRCIENELTGTYNVAKCPGEESLDDLLSACRSVTGAVATFTWVDEDWLIAQGVGQWTEMPLWRALPTAWSMSVDRALSAGLTCRPLEETVVATWDWMRAGGLLVPHERTAEHGIAPAREAELLARWRANVV